MIKLRKFSASYKNKMIFDNINLDIPDRGINFLMGKNGSGKTTLIKCILDFMEYKGDINISFPKYNTKNLFVIFDDSALYNKLSGVENIMQFASCDKQTAVFFAEKYLHEDILIKPAKSYSYGERKKIFLSILEILKPKIIIMDEVSNGLDYETMILLKEKIKEFSKDSLILVTGHQFEFYKNIVERVFVINNKSIEQVDMNDYNSLEEIYEKSII